MTNRERVIAAIKFQKPDYTPHNVDFTGQMYDKMVAYTGNPDYRKTIHNHVAFVDLGKAQEEIRPGYFRDEFGVVWNKTGVDKDIGVIDSIQLEEPE
ncbi:MAG: uroporphyrinogen decarboxylase, partial [Clostridia bacterium]|nr:uroporphyrinogen decarboxylase [Clostridia bacterium]